jgi:polyvinyl alcohol dehydrogenase (cytochrome)
MRRQVGATMSVALLFIVASRPAAAQAGAAAYRRDCASCHDASVDRAPNREALQAMTAERVLNALESGAMLSMASRSSAAERRAIAQYVTGKSLSKKELDTSPAPQAMCTSARSFNAPLAGPMWNGWGDNTFNTRFQDATGAGITAADVPRLKVKWAFGFPGDLDANAQPTLVGGRVFVGSQGGTVYSLSAETGCIYWFVKTTGAVRGAVTIGRIEMSAGPVYTAFFGDLSGNVYGVNAATGASLWKVRADAHPLARIVGSPVFHAGRVYVPVASAEETAGAPSDYECCRFSRQRAGARRGHGQTDLEDVHDCRRGEADEEEQ